MLFGAFAGRGGVVEEPPPVTRAERREVVKRTGEGKERIRKEKKGAGINSIGYPGKILLPGLSWE